MSFLNNSINESSDYSIDKIETFINNKVTFNVYKRNWSQLELIYKKHKLKEFMENIFQDYNISENNKITLHEKLNKILTKSQYNKLFKYDKELTQLTSIKCLILNDNSILIDEKVLK